MADTFSRIVGAADAGIRLDQFLANQPEVAGRANARRLVDAGQVTVAGLRVRPGMFLQAHQVVEFVVDLTVRDPLAPDLPLPEIAVLYEDESLCAIDKPVGLAAHPSEDKSVVAHTVASWALARFGELPASDEAPGRPGIVHRLDRDTSGVMVVAKTQVAFEFLRAQFKARTVQKEYRCLVFGEPRFQSDWIERPGPCRGATRYPCA
jgi:23S rRNA pseudouridine1911/1915/1917 synthase